MTNTEKLDLMIAEANPDVELAKGKVWEYAEIGKMVMDLIAMDPFYHKEAMADQVIRVILDNLSYAPQGIPIALAHDKITKGVQCHLCKVRKQAIREIDRFVDSLSENVG